MNLIFICKQSDLFAHNFKIYFTKENWNSNMSLESMVINRDVRGIFFTGDKIFFPDFFPGVKCFFLVENSHFGRPRKNFLSSLSNLSPFYSPFATFPLISFFSSLFSLSSLPLFSRKVSRNFPVRSVGGTLPPPAVTPLVIKLNGDTVVA